MKKRASKAGAGNIKCGNVEVANLGKVFNDGINQRAAYNKIENELTTDQIKKQLYNMGAEIYNEFDEINEMLEVSKNLKFKELVLIFDMLDSKEKMVKRFEQFEEYVKTNIEDIKTDRDIKKIKRIFKLG